MGDSGMRGEDGMDNKQMEEEIAALKKRIEEFKNREAAPLPANANNADAIWKYLTEEREKTNALLREVANKVRQLEGSVAAMGEAEKNAEDRAFANSNEIPLSYVDAQIIDFVQTRKDGMACADEVRKYMNYKGNNAACARLSALHKLGLLERFQMGHKVYYRFDAGKATNTLIVSPPQ